MSKHFTHGKVEVITNVEYSKIGAGYPRIFIKMNGTYHNIDLTIGTTFPMSEADWKSWFDEELQELATHEEIVAALTEVGFDAEGLLTELTRISEEEERSE